MNFRMIKFPSTRQFKLKMLFCILFAHGRYVLLDSGHILKREAAYHTHLKPELQRLPYDITQLSRLAVAPAVKAALVSVIAALPCL